MSSKTIPSFVLCAFVLGVMTAANHADAQPYDVNDPSWMPSDCFVAAWDSATFSAQLLNPDENPNQDAGETSRTLSISINLYEADCWRLLALERSPDGYQAIDDQDRVLSVEGPSSRTHFYSIASGLIDPPSLIADRPEHVTLSFPLEGVSPYPTFLKELRYAPFGLFSNTFVSIDVPFVPSHDWIEVVPGYSILMEEAVSSGEDYTYRYQIKYEGEGDAPSDHVFLHDDESLPPYVDLGAELLNAEGHDVYEISSGGKSAGRSGSGTNVSGRGTCERCGEVATIRFNFAVDPYAAELSYVLTDIPLPSL